MWCIVKILRKKISLLSSRKIHMLTDKLTNHLVHLLTIFIFFDSCRPLHIITLINQISTLSKWSLGKEATQKLNSEKSSQEVEINEQCMQIQNKKRVRERWMFYVVRGTPVHYNAGRLYVIIYIPTATHQLNMSQKTFFVGCLNHL